MIYFDYDVLHLISYCEALDELSIIQQGGWGRGQVKIIMEHYPVERPPEKGNMEEKSHDDEFAEIIQATL